MIFTIEALDASEGDCLLLHHGSARAPGLVLVDGGPARTYARALAPRLRQLRAARGLPASEPLPIDLAVLTHVDDDHVAGLLKLFEALSEARADRKPALASVAELWHNSFDDVVGRDQVEAALAFLDRLPVEDPHGTVAGTRQGRALRDLAAHLRVAVNQPFRGLVARPDDAAIVVDHHGLRLTVLSPGRADLANYQARWDADIKGGLAGRVASAGVDTSTFNLASIVLLVERGGRQVLLAGDGRADQILAGLEAARACETEGTCHVDVFKLPHHGSCRNVTPELLARVTADTYILSANGKHGNPDLETLAMLVAARGHDAYTLAVTFPEAAFASLDPEQEPERRAVLKAVDARLHDLPAGVRVVFREPDALGVRVDLGDEQVVG